MYPTIVDGIDTSRTNVDVSNKYKHIAARRTWRKERGSRWSTALPLSKPMFS
jgi:hypothetical protein